MIDSQRDQVKAEEIARGYWDTAWFCWQHNDRKAARDNYYVAAAYYRASGNDDMANRLRDIAWQLEN